jgi:PAS domain S-box-containing protein
MSVDENVFFREATLRICSSLDIETALKRCFEYIGAFIPVIKASLHTVDYDLDLLQVLASVGGKQLEGHERVLPLPEKGRNKRAADLRAALAKNEVLIIIVNQPDQEVGLPEILERFGLKSDVSVMIMYLKLESNLIGILGLAADGLNQYNNEHARLLQLLHEPFAIAMSNALRHREIIRFRDELMSHLRFFQNMDRVNRAMQGTNDLEQMMSNVLDAMLSIFDCDRAHLLYPCDPDAPSFEAVMERTRPEYPGRRGLIPTTPDAAKHFQLYLASGGAVTFGPGCDYPLIGEFAKRFGHKSSIEIALYPKTGKPWVLGMHQCSYPRVWSQDEKKLLEEIARRMSDVLTGLLGHRDLHESEERHRVALQTAMDGFFRTDMQGRILDVNEVYCRMSGYSEQELLTMNIADIEALHDAEMIAANIRKTMKVGPNRFESVHRRKDGSLFDVEISCQYQSIAGGQAVVFVRDITERKRAEQALRRSEAYLAEAQRLTHMGTWADDGTMQPVYWSEEVFRMFGLDPQQGIPTRDQPLQRVHPEDLDGFMQAFHRAIREKVDSDFEFRTVLPDGTVKYCHALAHPVLNANGELVEVLSTTADITERKKAEEALRQSEAYLAEAQRLSHTGSWAFDLASNKYVYLSEECFRIFGFDAQEDLPNREAVSRRIHPEDWDRVNGDFENLLREKVDTSSEFRIALPDGTVKHIQVIRHPVLNSAGDIVRIVGTAIDMTERKRAEEALRLAGVYNRSLIEASLDPLVTIDKQGKISDVNAATEQVTGYSREQLVGTDFSSYFSEPEKAHAGYQQVFNQGFVRDYELEIRNRNGKITPVLYNASVYRDDVGNVIGVFAAARDITEQKRAEEARSRLAAIVESSNDAIMSEDLDGTFTSWNEGAERLYGYSAAEALGRPVSILLPPDQKDQPLLLRRIREGIRIEQYETERVRKDGRMVNVSLTLSPVRNRQGKIIGASAISRDITERKRAEAEINSLKNYLSNIIDSMPSILVGLDNARTVTQWNRQAEAFTGIPAGEAIGKPIVHLLPDFAPWIMTMGTDMDEHRPSSMEKLLIEKEGERRFYDLMLYPLLIHDVGGAVLRIEDVTERAHIQELMVQTEKMMSIGGLAAGMAHEINNPLGIITQAAQNIERRISLELHANRKVSEELGLNLEGIRAYFDKRQISDAIASIRTASSRAAKIVANMLQFSRRADTTMESTSLAQIVDQALDLAASDYDLKKKYDFRSIEIIKEYEDTPQVRIVSVEIEQVILNLLKNAAQAMTANPPDTKPRITLRLRCEDRYAVLEVEDNGPGMTEDIRRRIFEPFFTTKEPGVGTGLGLSVSYMIVTQNHKGLMEVQPTPGRGTLFKVRLPIGESKHE